MRIHMNKRVDLLVIIDPRVRVADFNHKFAVMLSRQLCAAENRTLAVRPISLSSSSHI
ncbi:MAG: hypothetical protein QOJ15_7998 [Bradyrhizobium sp.]|jgi:hypothetical protein|nr:hypothetical protein [Bradyrhizobium sp.]